MLRLLLVSEFVPLVCGCVSTMGALEFTSAFREFRFFRKKDVETSFVDGRVIEFLFAV
jgi:hypothetical protein